MVRELVLLLIAAAANAAEPQAPLQFRITEGRVLNAFYQQGPVAAHLLLSSGAQPRLLWSWRYVDGRYQAAPFGQNNGDADESNAAQLWSTVYLAIPPPAADRASVSPLIGLFGFNLQRPLSR